MTNEEVMALMFDMGLHDSLEKENWIPDNAWVLFANRVAELIVKECIEKIEKHRIPVGNSAAGEMACEWTYSALKEIRDEIKEHFGIEL